MIGLIGLIRFITVKGMAIAIPLIYDANLRLINSYSTLTFLPQNLG